MHLSPQTRAKVELYKRQQFDDLGLLPKQIEALKELHPMNKECRVLTYGGGAFGGKSWLIGFWQTMNALGYEGIKQYIARNELKRLMSSTYVTFLKVAASLDLVPDVHWRLDGKYNVIIFANGSRIDLLDVSYQPRDPLYERFGSTEYTCGANEEAGEIHFDAFDILYTRTGRHLNKEHGFYPKNLNTANPKKNWLYDYFYRPWRDGELEEDYRFIQSLPTDNTFGDPQYIESLKKTKDKVKRERLLFGNWDYEDDPSKLMDYDKILDMWTNDHVKGGKKYITADIAGRGSDHFRVWVWDGFRVIYRYNEAKSTGKGIIDKIEALKIKYSVPNSQIVYDGDGIGGGLSGFIVNTHEFLNQSSAKLGQNYRNLKSQCAFMLADKVNDAEINICDGDITDKAEIVEEFDQLKRAKVDSDAKLEIIPKEAMKDRLNRSPDHLDNAIMRMYFELSGGVKAFNPNFF